MHKIPAALVCLLIFGTLTTTALAQRCRAGAGMPNYDVKTEATLTGTIESVQQQHCMGKGMGTHIMLKTQSETVEVCVGPSAYIQEKGFSFTNGEQVEVLGSRAKISGKDVIVARQITKGTEVLTLRNEQGIPAWSGGRGRNN